jgi:hypothetical protein
VFTFNNYPCEGCGKLLKNFGSVGNHSKFAKDCTPAMRFWGKVKRAENGCWLWQGAVNTTGYGMANWTRSKNLVAHRLAWELLRGQPPAGLRALHKCDTPRCVNPDHIFWGTQKDNSADAMAKGRTTLGKQPKQRLIDAQKVREIRALKAAGAKGVELAKKFGIHPNSISSILTGRTWSRLK